MDTPTSNREVYINYINRSLPTLSEEKAKALLDKVINEFQVVPTSNTRSYQIMSLQLTTPQLEILVQLINE